MVLARPAHPPARSLAEIAAHLELPAHDGGPIVTGLTLASGRAEPGDLFAALPGARSHGAVWAGEALARGACAVLTDQAGADLIAGQAPCLITPDPRAVLGELAAWFYGDPAADLDVFGVTGTSGKTTVASLVHAAMSKAWGIAGFLGTTGMRIGETSLPQERTTLEAPDLHAALALMRERGVRGVALEISSHALALHRVDGLRVDVAAFTNLMRDHLDFHADEEDYFGAKTRLFSPERARVGLIAADSPWGRRLAEEATIPVTTIGRGDHNEWRIEPRGVVVDANTTAYGFALSGPDRILEGRTCLVGAFNQDNAALALLTCVQLGIDPETASRAIAEVRSLPGRMEPVAAAHSPAPLAIVDFAHTPGQVQAVLAAIRPATSGRVLLVIGAGGDRDQGKRPAMGAVAAAGADVTFVTDDNPRSEDPAAIRADILAGARGSAHVREVAGRGEAIRRAVESAKVGDTIIVAGKGHETDQEAQGERRPWDDRVELAAALEECGPWA